jgi:LDH2 family malate/lactate/ureidoglycolate dehydrogenase
VTTVPLETVVVDPGRLQAFVEGILQDLGFTDDDAQVGAEALVRTDVRGTHSHGVSYLPIYLKQIRAGGVRPGAKPHIIRETPGTAVVDGEGGLGHIVTYRACEIAVRKAREVGTATVLVQNSNHFGAAGFYTLKMAEWGMIGIVASNGSPIITAPGATRPVISNQPISYGAPDPDGHGPVILDIALSEVAGSKIGQVLARGGSIPEGWIVGPDGLPSSDPSALSNGGGLVPIGGHKGYGLAVLVELLAGVLSGAGITNEMFVHIVDPDKPSLVGHWITAFNIEAFMPIEEFTSRLAGLRAEIHATPTIDGVDGIVLPGEFETRHERDTAENGLELEIFLWNAVSEVAAELGRTDELEATRR